MRDAGTRLFGRFSCALHVAPALPAPSRALPVVCVLSLVLAHLVRLRVSRSVASAVNASRVFPRDHWSASFSGACRARCSV